MMKNIGMLTLVLFPALFLGGCFAPGGIPKSSHSDLDFTPNNFRSSDFAPEITKLIGISEDTKTSSVDKAEAHRRLAILFLSPENPRNNFRKAVAELGKFLENDPARLDQTTGANWLKALTTGKEYQEMKEHLQKLKDEVVLLEEENKQLVKDKKNLNAANTELKKIIEKLKKLDLSLEKRRRDLR